MTRMLMGVFLLLMTAAPASALPTKQTSSSREDAQTYFTEGKRHQDAGEFKQAIDAYEASLEADPNQAEALSNLGFCYKSLKRYHKAITNYQHAIRLDPDLAEAHEYLGEAYLELGQVAKARREYDILVKLGSDEAEELKEKIDAAEAAGASMHAR